MRALIFAAAVLLLPQVALADYLKAPAEEAIPHLTDLELCQHHFVRPMPKIVDEVKARYLKCDRLLEMAEKLKQESKPEVVKASISEQQAVLDRARIRADAERRDRLEKEDAQRRERVERERLAVERQRLAEQRRQFESLRREREAVRVANAEAARKQRIRNAFSIFGKAVSDWGSRVRRHRGGFL